MNNKIYMLTAIAACIGLLLTGLSDGQLESSVTLSFSGAVQQTPTPTPTGPYSYIISLSGSNYQMKDGTTGQIIFQSTSSSQVFSNVVGNCSVGSCIDVESGVYTVNTMWNVVNVNNVTINFENGAKLIAGNSLNAPVLMLYSNNSIVNGVTIDGNAANQAESSAYGIMISGSNIAVNNAVIYNCRMVGVDIAGSPIPVHSGVTNSLIYNCGWNGVTIYASNCYLKNSEIYGCSDVGVSTYGTSTQIIGNYIHDMNGTTGSGGNTLWGIGIEGGSNAVITQNTITNCADGVYNSGFDNCTVSGNTITGGGNSATTNSQYGVVVEGKYGTVANNYVTGIINNPSAYLGGVGIFLQGATFSSISGNYLSQNGVIGICLDSTSNNNTVTQNFAFDQKGGNFALSAYHGVGIDIVGRSNYISQNQAFDDRSGAARTQEYGVVMESGASSNTLIRNNVYNNLDGQIHDLNVPENTIINNTGYNPVGYIACPISGSTAYLVDSGSNSTWISGRVYTNTASPKVLNISAGAVSVVAQNGVTLFTATGCTVTLQPGDTFSVTFSTAPTINVIGQ